MWGAYACPNPQKPATIPSVNWFFIARSAVAMAILDAKIPIKALDSGFLSTSRLELNKEGSIVPNSSSDRAAFIRDLATSALGYRGR
jgi:hypothetical protein